jgi:hypothetical protein
MDTENLIRGVDDSVTGRTAGTLTTEAQRVKQIANERAPLDDAARTQNQALQVQSQNLGDLNNRAMTEAEMALSDQESQGQYLSSLYQTLFGREAADEERRRFDISREDALRESAASRAAAAAQANQMASLFSQPQAGAPQVPDIQQEAYNEVRSRVDTMTDQEIVSDYKSAEAGYKSGIAKDQYKLALYKQLRPDLFTPKNTAPVISNLAQLRF